MLFTHKSWKLKWWRLHWRKYLTEPDFGERHKLIALADRKLHTDVPPPSDGEEAVTMATATRIEIASMECFLGMYYALSKANCGDISQRMVYELQDFLFTSIMHEHDSALLMHMPSLLLLGARVLLLSGGDCKDALTTYTSRLRNMILDVAHSKITIPEYCEQHWLQLLGVFSALLPDLLPTKVIKQMLRERPAFLSNKWRVHLEFLMPHLTADDMFSRLQ